MSTQRRLDLVRDILSQCEEDHMRGQRYQDPPIEVRNNVPHPYRFIRPYVPVITTDGLVRKRQTFNLGRVDQTTMRQAKARKEEIMAPINGSRILIASQLTFSEVVKEYLAVHIPTLGPAARNTYSRHIRLHILPAFALSRISDITKLEVQAWLNSKGQDYGRETVKDLRKVLHHIFAWAEDNQLWEGKNPCDRVKTGGIESTRDKSLPSERGLMRFLGSLKDTSIISAEGARLIVLTAISTGLRISEVLGLQVRDVDPAKETIRVERRWARGNCGPTKTKDSRRIRQVPGLAAELLLYCRGRLCSDYMFARNDGSGNPPDDRDLQQHVFRPSAESAGIYSAGFGMHRFRHLNISWRQEAGAHPFEAQKAAGHAQPSTTWRYTQTDAEREKAHVRTIMDRLQEQPEGAIQ